MPLDPHERLILALDVPSSDEAKHLVATLGDSVRGVKVGLELFTASGPEIVRWLVAQDKRVFLDLKVLDIPETIRRAAAAAAELGVSWYSVQPDVNTILSAIGGSGGHARPMHILVLITLSSAAVSNHAVREQTTLAMNCAADGVIAPVCDVPSIRKHCGTGLFVVTPGIRPAGMSQDEHLLAATPTEAILVGADYLVVGRPIRDAADPQAAAKAIQAEIRAACEAISPPDATPPTPAAD